jgi:hypothetical protein
MTPALPGKDKGRKPEKRNKILSDHEMNSIIEASTCVVD